MTDKVVNVKSKIAYGRKRLKDYATVALQLTDEQRNDIYENGSLSEHFPQFTSLIAEHVKVHGAVNKTSGSTRSYWVKKLKDENNVHLFGAFNESDLENYNLGVITDDAIDRLKEYSRMFRVRRKDLPPVPEKIIQRSELSQYARELELARQQREEQNRDPLNDVIDQLSNNNDDDCSVSRQFAPSDSDDSGDDDDEEMVNVIKKVTISDHKSLKNKPAPKKTTRR